MNSKTAVEPTSTSLKEALCAQQKLLQKLYNELDVEREAAATAASEAMSMILRLQGEKAAVTMEAEQYKRLAEEKMNHVEESMETLDEIMYHKEMEIASLDYQVQAYRYRLLSLGVDDLGAHEIKFPEYLLQRHESLAGETSTKTPPPRRLTLPNLKKGHLERDRSITEDSDTIAKIVEESLREDEHNQSFDLGLKTHNQSIDLGLKTHNQSFDLGLKTEFPSSVDISSYLEQIRELDKVVEQVAGDEYPCSVADKTSRCSSIPSKINELDLAQSSQKSIDDKISSDTCSPSVCDVFEVPQIEETLCKDEGKSTIKDEKSIFKDEKKSIFKDEGKSIFKDEENSIFKDVEKSIFKDEGKSIFKDEGKSIFKDDEKVKKLTSFAQSPIKSYHKHEIDPGKRGLFSRYKKRKVFTHGDGTNVDRHLPLVQPTMTTGITNSELVAVEQNVGQEKVASREERELRLLYEMNEKLDSIKSEIRSRNTKVNESSSNYDLPMLQLKEALWDLWI